MTDREVHESATVSQSDGPRTDEEADGPATVCPFCAVGCTLAPGREESRRARGRPGPVNTDGHLCPKGIGAFDAYDRKERLTRPQVRRDGELVSTTWSEALGRAAESLASVRDDDGPDALAFLGAPHCTNEENYLLGKLARTLGTNNVDNRARICHASAANALADRLGWPAMTNSLDDLATADVILVVGANPADQQPIAFDSYIRPAVDAGATLIHVDPMRNRTTRKADVHVAPRPGTDALVASMLCALVVDGGFVDGGFVDERTTGYDDYVASLDEIDVVADAALADVDPEDLARVARLIGEADRTAVVAATGIEDPGHETSKTANALVNLLLLTGNLGRSGTGMNLFRGLNNEQGATDAGCRPDELPGHQSVSDSTARDRVAKEWGVSPPTEPGLDEQEALAAFGDGVHAALVVGENPAVAKRDDDWVREKFESLDALVVVDVFPSDTIEYADVVLPAASGLEKAGTVTNLDRRVQRLRPVVEPPGDARPDFEILRALGRCLVGDTFEYDRQTEVFEELTRVSPIHEKLTMDTVGEGGVQWPVREDGTGTAILYEDQFDTSDGRARFVAVDAGVQGVPDGELVLVVGSRAGGFEVGDLTDSRLHVHEADAAEFGVEDGEKVVVWGDAADREGETEIETIAVVGRDVREGTVSLHADVADPLVRSGVSTVQVRSVES